MSAARPRSVSMFFTTATVVLTSLLLGAAATPAAGQGPQALAEELVQLCETHRSSFDNVYGSSMYYGGSIEDARQAAATLAEVEESVLPAVQPVLGRVASEYGTTAMDVSNGFDEAGVEVNTNLGSCFDQLHRGVRNVATSRTATAEALVQKANQLTGNVDFFAPDIRVQKMEEAKAFLEVAHRVDPTHEEANEMLATIDMQITNVADAIQAEIDAATWAGHTDAFSGPGAVSALASAALSFFRAHPNWTGDAEKGVEVLEVAVRGEWAVADTDIFGRPISWRLPIHLAITDGELRQEGLVRVYDLSVVTQEGSPGSAAKAPPFAGYWVGESWFMRADKL